VWRQAAILFLLFLIGWGGQLLSRRAPAWIREDPIVHPFGSKSSLAPQDGVSSAPADSGPPLVTPDSPLDINRATERELTALPRVGPVIAGRILALRDSLGGFERPEELLAVKGVGERTLARLRPLLRFH
jgi:competence protein ComEA